MLPSALPGMPGYRKITDPAAREHVAGVWGVAPEALPAIYQGATLFLYPTLYEGFGLPVIEAMASGVAVITSNTSALKEIAEGYALLVDPLDLDGMAKAIAHLMGSPERRNAFAERGLRRAEDFRWDQTARKTLDTAISHMSQGLMMFDADSRVILCNQRYIDLYRLPAGAITPGLTLRQVPAMTGMPSVPRSGRFADAAERWLGSGGSRLRKAETSAQYSRGPSPWRTSPGRAACGPGQRVVPGPFRRTGRCPSSSGCRAPAGRCSGTSARSCGCVGRRSYFWRTCGTSTARGMRTSGQ